MISVYRATQENLPTVILGDMNLCSKKWSKKDYDPNLKPIADKWKSTLARCGQKMENMGYTWRSFGVFNGIRRKSALDHIYHTEDVVFSAYMTIDNSMSDHFKPILCTVHIKQPKTKAEDSLITRRSWKDFKEDEFVLDLINSPWEKVFNPKIDVSQQAQEFDNIMVTTLNKHAKLRKTKIKPYFQKGLSFKTKKMIKERERLRKAKGKCKVKELELTLIKKHSEARNKVTSNTRKEKKQARYKEIEKSQNRPIERSNFGKIRLLIKDYVGHVNLKYLLRVVKKLTSVLIAGYKKFNKNYPYEPTL